MPVNSSTANMKVPNTANVFQNVLRKNIKEIKVEPKQRRENLIGQMQQLSNSQVDCSSCDGKCCSYKSNSMQVTPLETRDILTYLKEQNRWNSSLKDKLKKCINDFRLDKEISTGKNTTFRRTYTCPFYTPGPKGCSIPPEYKPYGCLAFNPARTSSEGEHCESDIKKLEEREKKYDPSETELNHKMKNDLGLWWDKLPIPYALLELDKRLEVSGEKV